MVIFFVVVFGFFTFFVAGGVTFTVKEHLPAFRPFTTFVFETEQTFFEAALTVVTIFDFATTLVPSVFKAEVTETVLPFFTDTTFGTTTPGVVPPTPGVPAPGAVPVAPPLVVALKARHQFLPTSAMTPQIS